MIFLKIANIYVLIVPINPLFNKKKSMRIHVLKHDDDEYTSNLDIWTKKRGFKLEFSNIELGEPFPSIEDFDWLVLYGGDQHVYDEIKWPWLAEEKKLVTSALGQGKTVVGFCLGAQVLAAVAGAENFALEHPEYGVREVSLSREGKEHPLLQSVSDPFTSFHMHSDHYSLPKGCTRLAGNEATENQMFVMPSEQGKGVGCQFHPEYTKDFARYLVTTYPDFWPEGPFVPDKEALLAGVEGMEETSPLFEKLMDNILRFFKP